MLENICALFSFQRTSFVSLSRADFKYYILRFLFCQQLFSNFFILFVLLFSKLFILFVAHRQR